MLILMVAPGVNGSEYTEMRGKMVRYRAVHPWEVGMDHLSDFSWDIHAITV